MQSRNVPDVALEERIAAFTNIPFFETVASDDRLVAFSEGVHTDWSNYETHFRKLWQEIFEGEEFEKLLSTPTDFAAQKRFLKYIYQVPVLE